MVEISDTLDLLIKPLLLASKDNFAKLPSIKGIEGLVAGVCDRVLGAPGAPSALRQGAASIRRIFAGFDSNTLAAKRRAVIEALEILERPLPVRLCPSAHEAKAALKRLKTPLKFVKGIGPRMTERLSKKGLETVEDLLYFLPIRYEDRRRLRKISALTPGLHETASGEILALGQVLYGRRRVFEIALSDGSAILKLKWFNFRLSYMKRYKPGQRCIVFGQVSVFGRGKEMIHPDVEIVEGEGSAPPGPLGGLEPAGIVPVYSQVEGFHQKTIRKLIRGVAEEFSGFALGGLAPASLKRHGLLELSSALKAAHCPADAGFDEGRVRRSIAFDELFLLEIALFLKRDRDKKEAGIRILHGKAHLGNKGMEERLRAMLPFRLTDAQERTLSEIGKDMSAPHPMNRLIQGDVGSGKTVVSLISAVRAVEAGYQAAIMAPTEILAEQHFLTTHKYAEGLGIRSALIIGGAPKTARVKNLDAIKNGGAGLVIGTHALIQKDVEFKALGLAVIDEQHRFGVEQRAMLRRKGAAGLPPDTLIMTATPIPRTLSMTVFGDLDVSVIDELPPGRHPVETTLLREGDRRKAYEIIRTELKKGSQAYIVYPLVEESKELSLRDAVKMQSHLGADVFPEFKTGLLHGRMKSVEKEAVMKAFKAGEIRLLVSTTVIEVGVDVPNATVMLIEHAERFGLAQLHQLRGRVGRGDKKSVCLLLAQWTTNADTYKRLKVMERTNDGFLLAEEDLKIRGPGDFLGTRQAGLPDFRIAGALADLVLVKKAREEALGFIKQNPAILATGDSYMKEVLKSRWAGRFELAEIG